MQEPKAPANPKDLDGTSASAQSGGLRFKSAAEQMEAISKLPDRPPLDFKGDVEAWQREQETQLQAIESATIGGANEPPAPASEGPGETPAKPKGREYNESDWTIQAGSEKIVIPKDAIPDDPEFTFKNAAKAFKGVVDTQRYFKTVKSDMSELTSKAQKLENENTELRKRLEGLEANTPRAPQQPGPAAASGDDPAKFDAEIAQVNGELERIEQDLTKYNEFDEEGIKLSRKHSVTLRKLNDLTQKQNKAMWTKIATADDTRRKESEEQEKARLAREASKAESKKAVEDIEEFRKRHKEFGGDGSFMELDTQYKDFAREVAAAAFTKSQAEVTPAEMEIAMKRYLDGAPMLMEALDKKGIRSREPKGLRKYLIVSELDMLKNGIVLDQETGKWVQTPYKFRSLDSALDEWKRINGEKAKEQIEWLEKGERNVLDNIEPKGATEIPSGAGAQRGSSKPGLTKAEATEILVKIEKNGISDRDIEVMSRENPDNPIVKQYEEALTVLES